MQAQDAGFPEPLGNVPPVRREPARVVGRIEPVTAPPTRDPAMAPPALSAAPDLPALLRALRCRWMAAVALGVPLAALAAVAAWYLMTPKVTAFSQIRVAYEAPKLLGTDQAASQSLFSNYLRTQAALVKSRPVIAAALKRDEIKRLDLESRWPDPAAWLEDELKVDFLEPAEFLTLLFTGPEPVEAVALVKAVTAAFMDEVVYAEQRARVVRVADLEKIANELTESQKTKKENLRRLAESLGTTSETVLTQQQVELLASLREAHQQRNQARAEMQKIEAVLASHKLRMKNLQLPAITDAAVDATLKAEPEGSHLLARVARCKAIVKDYEMNANDPREPTRLRAERELKLLDSKLADRRRVLRSDLTAAVKEKLEAEAEVVRLDLESRLGTQDTFLKKLQIEVDELTAKSSKIGRNSHELEQLRDEIKREAKVLDAAGDQMEKLRLELRSPQRITVYQDAELQRRDMKKQIAAAAAAPVGVLFAVCMGLAWAEYGQRRIRTAGDVAGGLGIRVVGAVPVLPSPNRQLVVPAGGVELEGHPVLESIDAIRTQLLHEAGGLARVVMVTSAVAGEGKTTLASALSASLARAGRRTLLVDGDLRQPAVHQFFELPPQPGFSEVLLGEVEVAEAVQETTQENLAVMTAGQWDREVLQCLARDGLVGVFEKLREEYDFLIIDSHPILPAADSLLLAQRVDAVILSVLGEVSQAPRVYAASQRLEALGVRVLGAVVNGADPAEVMPPTLAYAATVAA